MALTFRSAGAIISLRAAMSAASGGLSMAVLELFKEQLENESRAVGEAQGLTQRGDLLIWWYFEKLLGLQPDEIEDSHCDGANDYGLTLSASTTPITPFISTSFKES